MASPHNRISCTFPLFGAFAASVFAAVLLAGCARNTVKIPAQDPTPPLSALDVVSSSGRMVLFAGEGPRDLELVGEDSVVLIGLGEDRDGGVKDLTLAGKAVVLCADSLGRGEAMEAGAFSRRHVLPGAPGKHAPFSKHARYVLHAGDFRKACGKREFLGVIGAAGVRTVNFHGQSAKSPTLAFRIKPLDKTALAVETEGWPAQKSQDSRNSPPVFGPIPPWEMPDTPRI